MQTNKYAHQLEPHSATHTRSDSCASTVRAVVSHRFVNASVLAIKSASWALDTMSPMGDLCFLRHHDTHQPHVTSLHHRTHDPTTHSGVAVPGSSPSGVTTRLTGTAVLCVDVSDPPVAVRELALAAVGFEAVSREVVRGQVRLVVLGV